MGIFKNATKYIVSEYEKHQNQPLKLMHIFCLQI